MSLLDIELALQTALKNVTDVPDIAWPNTKFDPKTNEPFIVPTLLASAGDVYTLSNQNKGSGIYQIDIYVPLNKGIKQLYTIADNVRTYYRSNKRLIKNSQQVFILDISPPRQERQDSFYRATLEIHYISMG